jgi:hypothetical protein
MDLDIGTLGISIHIGIILVHIAYLHAQPCVIDEQATVKHVPALAKA